MLAVEVTWKLIPLLGIPLAVTTTLPVVAPPGTAATMLVGLQLVGVADTPLKVTVPIVDPKFVPAIVTGVPTGPDVGFRLLMAGTDGAVGGVGGVGTTGLEGGVELPLAAGLNAAKTAAQKSVAPKEALAELAPVVARV
jgi:hypothetical protein